MIRAAVAALVLVWAVPVRAQESDPEKLRQEMERLKVEAAHKDARLADLQKQLDQARFGGRRLDADLQVYTRQIEVQLARIQELTAQLEEHRTKLAKAQNEKALAVAELQYSRQQSDRLANDLSALEEKYAELKRETRPGERAPGDPAPARAAEELLRALAPPGPVTPVPPSAALPRGSADELRALRSELEAVRRQVRTLSDRLLPSFQDPGAAFEPLSEEFQAYLGLEGGLIVRQVREGSAAARAGLQPGDVIPGRSEDNVLDALRQGHPFEVVRRGRTVMIPAARGR